MFLSTFYFVTIMLSFVVSQTCLREANVARANAGRPALRGDNKLENAAKAHNDWMIRNNCFSHQCPGEPSMGQRVTNAGYAWWGVGEVLAAGPGSCEGVIGMWLGSEGHRNILLGNYNDIGCATGTCSNCTYYYYWTCVFGVPRTFEFKNIELDSNNFTLSYQTIYEE